MEQTLEDRVVGGNRRATHGGGAIGLDEGADHLPFPLVDGSLQLPPHFGSMIPAL